VHVSVADGALQLHLGDASAGPVAQHVGGGVFRAGSVLLRFVEEDGRIVRASLDQGGSVFMLTRE
jgi:hypothetical protein